MQAAVAHMNKGTLKFRLDKDSYTAMFYLKAAIRRELNKVDKKLNVELEKAFGNRMFSDDSMDLKVKIRVNIEVEELVGGKQEASDSILIGS